MADSRAKRKGALIPREKAPTIDARYIVNGVSRHDLSSGSVPTAWSAITGKPSVNTTAPLTGGGSLASSLTLAVSTMTGDSGSGGARGVVPAPAAGDAAAGKFLKASGTWAVPTASVADGDKGDITVSGSGATWTIDNDTVTYAKMQDVSADTRILGRAVGAGAGDVTELTPAQVSAIAAVGDATNAGVLKLGAAGGAYPYDAIKEYQYTAAGSNALTIPTGATWCDIEIQGNGGPGGGGRRGAASSNRGAGGGGAAGGRVWRRFSVAELLALGSTLTLTIAAQASGGAGATTDSTNGSAGTAAAANTAAIGATTILTAPSGAAGVAGTTSSGTGGVATSWVYTGGDGGAGSTSAAVVGGTAMVAAGGGGGGGGISNTNSRVGGAAGGVGDYAMDLASGPAGGSSAGSAGTSATARSVLASGAGGGGGAAGDTAGSVAGGVGGDGVGGGGGGGGGGATNGANGGNGGKGGIGWIRVVFT